MNTELVKAYNGFSMEDLRKQLLEETDTSNIKDIVRQMNAHLQKKDMIRKTELSDLQDKITEQITKRITEMGDCFSNKDLLDYFKTMEDSINKIDPNATIPEAPQIKVDQRLTINMDKPELSRQEKLQVVDAVRSILARVQQEQLDKNILDGEYKEVNDQQ